MTDIFFLQILSDFIFEKRTEPRSNVDWQEILSCAENHQVAGIVYYQCKDFIDDGNVAVKLLKLYSSAIYNSMNFHTNYEIVQELLTQSNIPFVSVKGFQIAKLYPVPELRTMGDIDLLVHRCNFKPIAEIFLKLGFQYGKETTHEITFKKSLFYYEIHEFLIDKPQGEDELQKAFYNDYWRHLTTNGTCGELQLDWSFHFMFLLQHMRQHILWEGIGFRQFMDMAIVIRNVPELNWDYIIKSAKEIELYEFLCKVLALITKWFNVNVPISLPSVSEEFYNYVTEKIFDDGVFGFCQDENKTNVFEREYRKSKVPLRLAKLQNIRHILFPSYTEMIRAYHYSFLKGRPYLLPFAWFYRFYYSWKHKNYEQARQVNRIVALTNERLDKRRSDIEMWGL